MNNKVQAHYVVNNSTVHRKLTNYIPRIGEQVRIHSKFYHVQNVIHCPMEITGCYRVNIDLLLECSDE